MFHCAENLLLIHYWDVDLNVGRNFVISNTYQHIARKPKVGISQSTMTTIHSSVSAIDLTLILQSAHGVISMEVVIG